MKKLFFVLLMIISAMFFAVACGGEDPDTVNAPKADTDKGTADLGAKADSDDEADTDLTDSGDEANSGDETDSTDDEANTGNGEDEGDTDTDTGDIDTGDTDAETGDTDTGDTDTGTVDPCNPNKCLNDEHSDGICTPYPSEAELYSCGCVPDANNNNYQWYSGKCYKVVSQHRCQILAKLAEESFPIPDWATSALEFVCYCFSPDSCLALWEP